MKYSEIKGKVDKFLGDLEKHINQRVSETKYDRLEYEKSDIVHVNEGTIQFYHVFYYQTKGKLKKIYVHSHIKSFKGCTMTHGIIVIRCDKNIANKEDHNIPAEIEDVLRELVFNSVDQISKKDIDDIIDKLKDFKESLISSKKLKELEEKFCNDSKYSIVRNGTICIKSRVKSDQFKTQFGDISYPELQLRVYNGEDYNKSKVRTLLVIPIDGCHTHIPYYDGIKYTTEGYNTSFCEAMDMQDKLIKFFD